MKSLSARCAAPLALSLLLAALGCGSESRGIVPSGTGGSVSSAGGRGGRGGTTGTGGTTGGGGATATGGTSGSGGGTGGGTGGGGPTEAGPAEVGGEVGDAPEGSDTPDAAMAEVAPMPDMATPDMAIVPGGCGNYVAAANTTGGAEGIVVTPEGTLYFSQAGQGQHIGRIRPGMPVERTWVQVGPNVLGITYDPKRKLIYAGRRGMGTANPPAVLKIDVSGPTPLVGTLAPAAATINGITLGEDEAVYYTEETGRNVRRVTYFGQPSLVNASPLPGNPNGLAFGPDGKLYIVYFSGNNQVTRLTLTNGGETGREVYLANVGAAGADGIAFDDMGRLFVTAGGQLRRIRAPAMGAPQVDMMMASGGANIEFGVGALSCNDVYVGSGNAGIRRHTLADSRGANVPWHRPAP
jgi:sugar lactone lactonase YvrE